MLEGEKEPCIISTGFFVQASDLFSMVYTPYNSDQVISLKIVSNVQNICNTQYIYFSMQYMYNDIHISKERFHEVPKHCKQVTSNALGTTCSYRHLYVDMQIHFISMKLMHTPCLYWHVRYLRFTFSLKNYFSLVACWINNVHVDAEYGAC